MCRTLGVSASGYWARAKRPMSEREQTDRAIEAQIREIHHWSQGTYGVRGCTPNSALGDACGPQAGSSHAACGLQGVTRRKGTFTTVRDRDARPAPDLVSRNFVASAPNRLWIADITYIPTWTGFLYLAVVLDAWSRRVVGWAMETHLRTELVLQALDMALFQRRPNEVIHHSDQGCQYTSVAFGKRCGEAGVRPSMGSVGDAYDNAMCESFFATLECELLDRNRFRSQVEARIAVFQFIEGWYNPHRLHSGLGYLSPIEFERRTSAEVLLDSVDVIRSEETTAEDRRGKVPLGLPLKDEDRFHRPEEEEKEEDQERGLNPSP
jgi:putative transposase